MTWDLQSDRPIYVQLIEQIKLKICSGTYTLGSKLPSVRDLAQEAEVNPNTMQKALAKLEELGLLHSKRTSGRFITEDNNMIKTVKSEFVQEQIQDFLKKLNGLNIEPEEILTTMSNMLEEMKSDEYNTKMQ